MNQSYRFIKQTRRHFLRMISALGASLTLPVRGSRPSRLSRREASFYHKGRRDDLR